MLYHHHVALSQMKPKVALLLVLWGPSSSDVRASEQVCVFSFPQRIFRAQYAAMIGGEAAARAHDYGHELPI